MNSVVLIIFGLSLIPTLATLTVFLAYMGFRTIAKARSRPEW